MQYLARLQPDPTVRVEMNGAVTDLIAQDRDARTFLANAPILQDGDVDLTSFTTETDQYRLSACAGNATGDAIELLNDVEEKTLAAREGRTPNPPIQVSRLFIYNMTRQRLGVLHQDEGTYIRACFDTLSRFGVCEETVWPYDESKVFTSPSLLAQRRAVGNRIHAYYRIKDDDTRIDQIVAALRARHPVVFGTAISRAFMALQGGAIQRPPPESDIVGNHAMLIVGYIGGYFIVKNSWSRHWGSNGFCLMSKAYLMWEKSMDFWVTTKGTDFST